MLLYIEGTLSPQEIRDQLSIPGSRFEKALIQYLEGSHVGEFHQANMATMESICGPRVKHPVPKVTVLGELKESTKTATIDQKAALSMPEPPPADCQADEDCGSCKRCAALATWWDRFWTRTNELVYLVNVHVHRRAHAETRCVNKEGVCMARFPRELVPESVVDHADGSLKVKKLEENMNNVTPLVTYCCGCNTDVTSLMSGTAIKAIIAYISDYVSKTSLKSYQVFSSMYDVLHEK
ncbi:hypothetical protein C8R44DRAFT_536780, partial [Mycena epipterygia]